MDLTKRCRLITAWPVRQTGHRLPLGPGRAEPRGLELPALGRRRQTDRPRPAELVQGQRGLVPGRQVLRERAQRTDRPRLAWERGQVPEPAQQELLVPVQPVAELVPPVRQTDRRSVLLGPEPALEWRGPERVRVRVLRGPDRQMDQPVRGPVLLEQLALVQRTDQPPLERGWEPELREQEPLVRQAQLEPVWPVLLEQPARARRMDQQEPVLALSVRESPVQALLELVQQTDLQVRVPELREQEPLVRQVLLARVLRKDPPERVLLERVWPEQERRAPQARAQQTDQQEPVQALPAREPPEREPPEQGRELLELVPRMDRPVRGQAARGPALARERGRGPEPVRALGAERVPVRRRQHQTDRTDQRQRPVARMREQLATDHGAHSLPRSEWPRCGHCRERWPSCVQPDVPADDAFRASVARHLESVRANGQSGTARPPSLPKRRRRQNRRSPHRADPSARMSARENSRPADRCCRP